MCRKFEVNTFNNSGVITFCNFLSRNTRSYSIASSLNTLFARNLSSADNEALSIFIEEYLCPQEDHETLEGEVFFNYNNHFKKLNYIVRSRNFGRFLQYRLQELIFTLY